MATAYERALTYLEKIPGAGSGNRNSEGFRLSAVLQNDFKLFQDEAYTLLSNWGNRCDPPLDQAEIIALVQNGLKYANRVPGSKSDSQNPFQRTEGPSQPQELAFDEPHETILEFSHGSRIMAKLRAGTSFMPKHRLGRVAKVGILALDRCLVTGRGELGIIAAGTGVGKSTLATQGLWATAQAGYRTALVSLEMIPEQVEARIAAWATGVSHTDLFEKGSQGTMPTDDLGDHLNNVFYLCGNSGFSFLAMERSIEHAVAKHGISSIWVDYFTLVQPPDPTARNGSAQMYAELSKAFKRMAQQLDIAVVMLAQFNRTFNGKGEKPTMYNLKETSQLEQDASWILIMWEDANGQAWASIDKNRMGKSGLKKPIIFDHATQRVNEGEQVKERLTINHHLLKE